MGDAVFPKKKLWCAVCDTVWDFENQTITAEGAFRFCENCTGREFKGWAERRKGWALELSHWGQFWAWPTAVLALVLAVIGIIE